MLDPRLIALQGFGFQLTPIAIAVQGLIEQIQEEQRQAQVYGGHGAPRRAVDLDPWRRYIPEPTARAEPVTREIVEAQWDLLEAKLRNQRERSSAQNQQHAAPAASPGASASAPDLPAEITPASKVTALPNAAARRAEEEALFLLLMEL